MSVVDTSTILIYLQLEEAQKRHDLLMDILCKEQEHSRRLVSAYAHARTRF